jgi:glycosyltransferase involved in cell wall biosynthesis
MNSSSNALYSVIIPVGSRVDDLPTLIDEYAEALRSAEIRFEIVVVLDGTTGPLLETLRSYSSDLDWLRVIRFSREFGESVALMAGFSEAQGEVLLTLPAYWQVTPSEIPSLIKASSDEDDLLIAVRSPRSGSAFERFRRDMFHGILKFITGQSYRDLGCGVRLLKRSVVDEVRLYGDQHRFLPMLAFRRGFNVREVELAQSPKDIFHGRYRLREYLHRLLDILTVFFLVRFTKKPLRFFGSIGFLTAGFGSIFVLVLVTQRLFFGMPLADRPALLLASLLIVLGVQLFGLGLLGELIIFSHAGESKEYTIRSIVNSERREYQKVS